MPCGGVLREALKYDAVAALILYDEENKEGKARDLGSVDTAKECSGRGVFWSFFEWIVKSSFEVCTDAFNTFRVCLLPPSLEGYNANVDVDRKFSSATKK